MARQRNYYHRKRVKQIKKLVFGGGALVALVILIILGWPILSSSFSFDINGILTQIRENEYIQNPGSIPRELLGVKDEQDKTDLRIDLTIGVVSDSHGADQNLAQAIQQMQAKEVDLIIHLGDFSGGGEEMHFNQANEILETSGRFYYVIPGDHDFNWFPEYSRTNYEAVFGASYNQQYTHNGWGIILYENSISIAGDIERRDWVKQALIEVGEKNEHIVFFSAKPLYSPYFSDKEDVSGPQVLALLSEAGVGYIFAGDTHIYAQYRDPSDQIDIITVGAVGDYKNPLPQWVYVILYENGMIEAIPQPLVQF